MIISVTIISNAPEPIYIRDVHVASTLASISLHENVVLPNIPEYIHIGRRAIPILDLSIFLQHKGLALALSDKHLKEILTLLSHVVRGFG
jgi:hypothetical protein